MKKGTAIHWFRQDLRLEDNPALSEASKHYKLLPIYIFDDFHPEENIMGSASKWWLHQSLNSLKSSLKGKLSFYRGNPIKILEQLMDSFEITSIYWNRCYEPWSINRDAKIKKTLKEQSIYTESHNASLLWEPWTIKKHDNTPYKVFTPFYRKGCLGSSPPRQPIPKPTQNQMINDVKSSISLDQLTLMPSVRWDRSIQSHWEVGEEGAKKRFQTFIDKGLGNYREGRNRPDKPFVSRLSPHIHFGEISPNQLWYSIRSLGNNSNTDHFCSELGWREFSYSQLYHYPDLPDKNLQSKFDSFPWAKDRNLLQAWQKGKTGVPMVDAGMRELWQTGFMHNRVRMITGSYLVKNLRLDWRHGESWFWDTLLDADLASNSASWQWVAGCGADAAPYFRIFNPVTQGQKFDPSGTYVRKYIPEIKELPNKYLHQPWEAPASVLKTAGVTLGKHYPFPVVDLKNSREAALQAFKSLKTKSN